MANVIVIGEEGFDQSAHIHKALGKMHAARKFTFMVHTDKGVGKYAHAWALVTKDVSEILVRSGEVEHLFNIVPIRAVIVFGKVDKSHPVLKYARKTTAKIINR